MNGQSAHHITLSVDSKGAYINLTLTWRWSLWGHEMWNMKRSSPPDQRLMPRSAVMGWVSEWVRDGPPQVIDHHTLKISGSRRSKLLSATSSLALSSSDRPRISRTRRSWIIFQQRPFTVQLIWISGTHYPCTFEEQLFQNHTLWDSSADGIAWKVNWHVRGKIFPMRTLRKFLSFFFNYYAALPYAYISKKQELWK